jgi:hypothetical protein
MVPIDRSTFWMAGLSAAIFLLATAAAWLIGDHSIRRPVEKLLRAARAWQTGDFTAPAALPATGSEIAGPTVTCAVYSAEMLTLFVVFVVADAAREPCFVRACSLPIALRLLTAPAMMQLRERISTPPAKTCRY